MKNSEKIFSQKFRKNFSKMGEFRKKNRNLKIDVTVKSMKIHQKLSENPSMEIKFGGLPNIFSALEYALNVP
jgi:hypothetical protein